ncbi:DASH complex subunit Duo1-domain-containing protein [Massariosphaeria phaeospora]|uniref:DASH complex subunit DUO1 n=1 Tax=Massariosphaeria phaeospora TaxID=100035 RepID=A0A7C8MKX1_9PLEO|nr:DASH complex subunit Duo1-domain-containing protein [Massariosphaeria phaeospora]
MGPPAMDALNLSDSDSDAIFDTPAPRKNKKTAKDSSADAGKTRAKESHYTTEEARQAALRKELETVRNVNKVIEGVVESLQKAKDNMDTVSRTVNNASTLLQTWTRILSQTEHNQRLILNPQWQGATQDLVDIQDEEVQRQHYAERRAAEEQSRREAAARRVEEESRRAEAVGKTPRGRGRGGRARSTSTSAGYTGVGGQSGRGLNRSGSSSSRAGSGIGRGLRGRGRGLG